MNRDERLDQLTEHISKLVNEITLLKPQQKIKHIYIGYDNNAMPVATIDYE